jgi:hypothetical protein
LLENLVKSLLFLLVRKVFQNSFVVDFKTEFFFRKSESSILVDHILTHYEEIEEYEKCSEIIKLHKRLTNSEKSHILNLTNV